MKYKHIDVPFEKESVDPDGTFKGYGSTFGGAPDSYGDVIAPGAFSDTLAKGGRNGTGIAMLYQHNSDEPVGVYKELKENTKGLFVDGQMALGVQRAKEAHELMMMGAIKGLSIGFDLPRDKKGKIEEDAYEYDDKTGTTLLKRIELWEISLVTFPANTRARITGVKNIEEAKTVRDLEKALRESGVSKSDALYIAKLCRPSLRESGKGGMEEILESLNKAIANTEATNAEFYSLLDSLKSVNEMFK